MYILPKLKGKEIILYLRKSRADDPLLTVEEVLEKHEQLIADWTAQALPGLGEIPPENIYREVVSGETLDGRPRMLEALRKIESPSIKAILCKEPSRLSRGDLQDIGYLVKVLRYSGTLVLTPRGCYDLRDDRDREQFERELMRGNDYLEYQKKILKDGKLLAVKKGCYIGSYPPYGYEKVSVKIDKQNYNTLKPIPEEAEVVRRIFEMYRYGVGSTGICDALDAERVAPPRGDVWATGTINRILRNAHYIGKVTWYKVKEGHRVENGEIKKYKYTSDEYVEYDGLHPAIIDQELWEDVKAIRGKLPPNKKGTAMLNPFAGVMYCSCGKVMSYKQTRTGGKDIGAPRFRCSDRKCRHQNGSTIASEVIAEIVAVLQNCVEDFSVQIDSGTDNSAEQHKQTIERLEKRLEALRELEVKQWDEKINGGMPDHIFARLNEKTVADIEAITQALIEAEESAPEYIDVHEKKATFEQALALLSDPDAPVKEKNQLIKACIKRITYSRPRPDRPQGLRGNPNPFKMEIELRI